MKLYRTTIKPLSNFASSIKGDQLFGQICWIIKYKYGEARLEDLLADYSVNPFLIISDGFASGYLPKPRLPNIYLGENIEFKKQNRKKIWLTLEDLLNGNYTNAKTNEEARNYDKAIVRTRNAVNYKTFTTSSDGFAPFGEEESFLSPKDLYFLISEKFKLDELKACFEFLSQFGYGKNISIGKGRFEVLNFQDLNIQMLSSAFIALSAFDPTMADFKDIFYEPFTRFGKHPQAKEIKNSFKKPLLLADCGSVVVYDEQKDLQYIGRSITNHSNFVKSVHQGYSIVLPLRDLNV